MAVIICVRNNIALTPNIIFKEGMKNITYFVNKIILNTEILVEKAINSPADTNTTILELSKERIMPLPKIVLKSQKHCQRLLHLLPCLQYRLQLYYCS